MNSHPPQLMQQEVRLDLEEHHLLVQQQYNHKQKQLLTTMLESEGGDSISISGGGGGGGSDSGSGSGSGSSCSSGNAGESPEAPGEATVGQHGQRTSVDSDSEDVCWLCLAGTEEGLGQLVSPCRCPRVCHPGCLSRWQLHCAGRQEEKVCRFCGDQLPDWRHVPPAGFAVDGTAVPPPAVQAPPAYMRISYNGRSHKIRVRPGPDGTRQFIEDCRQLLKIPTHLEFDVVFHCKEPATQSDLRFRGLDAFDAAVYCASLANHAAALQQQQVLQLPESPQLQLPLPPAPPCPLPPPPPPPRALVRATSEVADELARMAAAAAAEADESAAAEDGQDQGLYSYSAYVDSSAATSIEQQEQQQFFPSSPPLETQLHSEENRSWQAGLAAAAAAAGLRSSSRFNDGTRSRSRSLGVSYSQGRNRRQRRADGLSSNVLNVPVPSLGNGTPTVRESYSAASSAGTLGIANGGVSTVSGGGSSSGGSSGMGSFASIAAAVGSVLGAFRRCGSWEGA
ncbi:hypothetical protein Vafri_9818 [Volvox africanus]|uniref:RING-CH-type domain-containing protein n=1 Tax=Volvox africanus TaxID=51714 RepID=A0A8J4B509_9CHLO|nr:hypothetical protein Vafri_9818 [Volvox africanus]